MLYVAQPRYIPYEPTRASFHICCVANCSFLNIMYIFYHKSISQSIASCNHFCKDSAVSKICSSTLLLQ
uniref:Uncharacterized protein n=1 Tax=Myoviridae sp. ctqfO1 TaxID=2827710 RepID=A0A8S5T2M8_9CAUD|nr:MAG TPA: hypothetical protein [Myoviridae sp. ctqfO1]